MPRNPFGRNGWLRVLYRRLNQWARCIVYRRLRRGRYIELLRMQAILANSPAPSQATLKRLRDINWTIGSGSVYRFTEEELRQQARWTEEILKEIKKGELQR